MFTWALSATVVTLHKPQRQSDQHWYGSKEKSYGPWFWNSFQRSVLLANLYFFFFFCDCGLHCGNKNQGSMRFIEHLGSLVSFYLSFMDKRLGRKLTLFKVPLLCPLYKLNNVVWMDLSSFFSFLKGLIGLCSLLINEQKIFNKIMCSKRCHL